MANKAKVLFMLSLALAYISSPLILTAANFPTENAPSASSLSFLIGDLPQLGIFAIGCGGAAPQAMNPGFEQRLVELVNTARQQSDIPPLKFVTPLIDAARYHAFDMGEDNYFDHDTYDRLSGNLKFICSFQERLQTFYTGWNTIGENIANGPDTPEGAMSLWMSSPGHRANILNRGFWEFGGGYYSGTGNSGRYWVQDFGRRNGSYPLVINLEAAETSNREVELYIYGEWDEFRLRNNSEPWSTWRPFHPSYAWRLPAQSGLHSVHVEMRSNVTSAYTADTIYLNLADSLNQYLFLPLISNP